MWPREAAEPPLELPAQEGNEPHCTHKSLLATFTSKQRNRLRHAMNTALGSRLKALPQGSVAIIFPFWEGGCSSTSSRRSGGTSTRPFWHTSRSSTLRKSLSSARTLRGRRERWVITANVLHCRTASPQKLEIISSLAVLGQGVGLWLNPCREGVGFSVSVEPGGELGTGSSSLH